MFFIYYITKFIKIKIIEVKILSKKIKEIMSNNVIAVLPSDTAEEAAILMREHNIGAIPVVSAGEVKGIITDRDIVTRCVSFGQRADSTKVSDLMSTDVTFITPDQTIQDAISIMSTEQIRRLPVVKDGYIDGMISFADVTRNYHGMEITDAITEINLPDVGPAHSVKTD